MSVPSPITSFDFKATDELKTLGDPEVVFHFDSDEIHNPQQVSLSEMPKAMAETLAIADQDSQLMNAIESSPLFDTENSKGLKMFIRKSIVKGYYILCFSYMEEFSEEINKETWKYILEKFPGKRVEIGKGSVFISSIDLLFKVKEGKIWQFNIISERRTWRYTYGLLDEKWQPDGHFSEYDNEKPLFSYDNLQNFLDQSLKHREDKVLQNISECRRACINADYSFPFRLPCSKISWLADDICNLRTKALQAMILARQERALELIREIEKSPLFLNKIKELNEKNKLKYFVSKIDEQTYRLHKVYREEFDIPLSEKVWKIMLELSPWVQKEIQGNDRVLISSIQLQFKVFQGKIYPSSHDCPGAFSTLNHYDTLNDFLNEMEKVGYFYFIDVEKDSEYRRKQLKEQGEDLPLSTLGWLEDFEANAKLITEIETFSHFRTPKEMSEGYNLNLKYFINKLDGSKPGEHRYILCKTYVEEFDSRLPEEIWKEILESELPPWVQKGASKKKILISRIPFQFRVERGRIIGVSSFGYYDTFKDFLHQQLNQDEYFNFKKLEEDSGYRENQLKERTKRLLQSTLYWGEDFKNNEELIQGIERLPNFFPKEYIDRLSREVHYFIVKSMDERFSICAYFRLSSSKAPTINLSSSKLVFLAR